MFKLCLYISFLLHINALFGLESRFEMIGRENLRDDWKGKSKSVWLFGFRKIGKRIGKQNFVSEMIGSH